MRLDVDAHDRNLPTAWPDRHDGVATGEAIQTLAILRERMHGDDRVGASPLAGTASPRRVLFAEQQSHSVPIEDGNHPGLPKQADRRYRDANGLRSVADNPLLELTRPLPMHRRRCLFDGESLLDAVRLPSDEGHFALDPSLVLCKAIGDAAIRH